MTSHRDKLEIHNEILNKLRITSKTISFENYANIRLYNGIRTGYNDIFFIDDDMRKRLLIEHKSSSELLKPSLRARHVKRWYFDPSDLWLIYVPWMFPSYKMVSPRKDINLMNNRLKADYPAIYSYLMNFENELMLHKGKRAYAQVYHLEKSEQFKFEQPKIIVSRIAREPMFAYDEFEHYYNEDSTFSITGADLFSMSILNSRLAKWYFSQICSTIHESLRIAPRDIAQFPIIFADPTQRIWCEWLANILIHLYRPKRTTDVDSIPLNLMIAYFEQWLNGLVYELFFSEELHRHRLYLFEQCKLITHVNLDELTEQQRDMYLKALFKRVYDINHPVRAMLFDLSALNIVQLIEGMK